MGLVTGPWRLADLNSGATGMKSNGMKVFSCFHCGGGSSMGYKLAGFEVLGGVEIDPKMMSLYKKNHSPKHSYLMGVEEFNSIDDSELPKELFSLDVLDGSPPCSSFSMAGLREDAWGEKKKFREGQADQILDDLFFHFIRVAEKLRPKIVVAENVKGLLMGAARGYVKQIFAAFDAIGYDSQLFLLNASRMGVPQARERTFFVARKRALKLPKISLEFNESAIPFSKATEGIDVIGKPMSKGQVHFWRLAKPGDTLACVHPKGNLFTWKKLSWNEVANTATSGPAQLCPNEPAHISAAAQARIQSFPDDYDFMDVDPRYVCGMSVPPLMMQRVSSEIARWLSSNSPRRRPKASKP